MRLPDLLKPRRPRNSLAYVFYATDERHAVAIMVFVRLLRGLGLREDADIVALHLPLSARMVDRMRKLGIVTRLVAPIPILQVWYYRHCLVKLRAFALSGYERVLYLDADAIPLRSLDEILSMPMKGRIAAPRAYWLRQPFWTSALMLLRPSRRLWSRAKRHFGTARQTGAFDMDIVNREFASEIESLSPAVFCLDSEWEDVDRPSIFGDMTEASSRVSVVHFSAMGKPWSHSVAEAKALRPRAHPFFFELRDRWRATRDMLLADPDV